MEREVRKLRVGIVLLALAIYIALDPNGWVSKLQSSALIKFGAGSVLFATFVLFAVEGGWYLLRHPDDSDRIIGSFLMLLGLVVFLLITWAAFAEHKILGAVAGALFGGPFYLTLLRRPILALQKGQ